MVARDEDCDDEDATTYPGAPETCDGSDQDCDGSVDEHAVDSNPWYPDLDGDGWGTTPESTWSCSPPEHAASQAGDCDDTNPTTHPGAAEVCPNGMDDDCDGRTDLLDWYTDADGDGFGDPTTRTASCEAPTATAVQTASDCDDTDEEVHPAAPERCDDLDVDEDCDGLSDDADDAVTGTTPWYQDLDGDGWGTPEAIEGRCDPKEGWAPVYGDCDDDDPSIQPDADETWYDDVDQDCDGADDHDADADGHRAIPSGGDDCDDALFQVHPGEEEACGDGLDNDCDGTELAQCALHGEQSLVDAWAEVEGDLGSIGWSFRPVPDMDGDGADDLLVGDASHDFDPVAPGDGGAWLVRGPVLASETISALPSVTFSADSNNSWIGTIVEPANDIDGDGTFDLLIGSPQVSPGFAPVYLVLGPHSGTISLSSSALRIVLDHGTDCHLAGLAPVDDWTGDGYAEFVVADGNEGSDEDMWVFSGADRGDLTETSAIAYRAGFGEAEPIGDWNGDGLKDVALAGASGVAVYLADPEMIDFAVLPATWSTSAWLDISRVGDTDGDGFDDLLAGDATWGISNGRVWILHGPLTGTMDVTAMPDHLDGSTSGDRAGEPPAPAGDINRDGLDDIVVNAPGARSVDGSVVAGASWLVLGPASGATSLASAEGVVRGTSLEDYVYSMVGGGDLDDDGFDDLVVGVPGHRTDASSVDGALYLFQGGP